MKHKRNIILLLTLTACMVILCSFPVFAAELTEAEVEQAVANQGKEAVTGNIFIWFLCAIAFLKVSQKIDSFMASLGINVGNTGGNMMAELLIAGRSLASSMHLRGGGSGGYRAPSSPGDAAVGAHTLPHRISRIPTLNKAGVPLAIIYSVIEKTASIATMEHTVNMIFAMVSTADFEAFAPKMLTTFFLFSI